MPYTLSEHIEKSFSRLSASEYQIQNLFQPDTYDWPGDWEGRALLAFCNLYEMTGKKIPAMDAFIEQLPMHLNAEGFMGHIFMENAVDEQQLSGHGWLLCGLCEYYRLFQSDTVLAMAERMVKNLFLRALPHYDHYPVQRVSAEDGAVSGNVVGVQSGWKVSTDIGCAFICMDGLSRYYALTHDSDVYAFLEKTSALFMQIDKRAEKMQTHATLTAARGIFRFYKETGDTKYFDFSKELFTLYLTHGMTDTYENFNWFERKDTWTEPCAVTDSLILALWLYEETKDTYYHTLARRIWFNGLSFCHRIHGGAGPNTCVTSEQPYLSVSMFEAPFCCTMRYNEGLLAAQKNEALFCDADEAETIDEKGRHFIGDKMLVQKEDGEKVLLCDLALGENSPKKYLVMYK